jgi:hypothetical protein
MSLALSNAVGPIKLPGFKDIGPRQPTYSPNIAEVMPLKKQISRIRVRNAGTFTWRRNG